MRMIIRSARAARGWRTSSSIVWPRSLYSHKSAGHCNQKCSADSTTSPHNRQTALLEIPTKWYQRRRAGWCPLRKRAKSVSSLLTKDASIYSSGRDGYISFSRSCWVGGWRQERRKRVLCVARSSALSGWVTAAPSLAWWSAISLPVWPQWPGAQTIRIDFDMASTAAEACSWMIDESAELALLTTWTCDLQSHMMITDTND